MKRFWGALAVQLGKRAGLVSIVGLIVTLSLGAGISRLQFATGQDSYLNKTDQVYKDNLAYQKLFGGEAMLVLITMDQGHTVAELARPDNQTVFARTEKEMLATPGKEGQAAPVKNVISPVTALEFSDNLIQRSFDDPTNAAPADSPLNGIAAKLLLNAQTRDPSAAGKDARTKDLGTTNERLSAVQGPKTLDNPAWVDFLLHDNTPGGQTIRKPLNAVFLDNTHAQVVVRLGGNLSITDESKGSDAVVKAFKDPKLIPNATITVAGAPVLLKDINNYLQGGMLTLGAIAVAIMVVILLVLFDVRWRLLPLGVILIGVVWAFGLAGYLGIPLTLVTIAGLPVMLGVGIDYAIQMHARVEEEVIIDRAEHPIQETARNLGPALLVVTFDAVFAFAALYFAKVPMIRQFGLLLAVGIAVICLCSIIAPLSILGIREYKSPTKGRDFSEGPLGRFVVRIGSTPYRFAPYLAAVALVIFFGGLFVEGKLTLQTDPIQWVNQSSQGIKNIRTLERQVNENSETGVYVTARDTDLFSDKVATYLHTFTNRQLAKHSAQFLSANSMATPISFLTEVKGASSVAPTGEELRTVYEAAPRQIQEAFVSVPNKAMNVIFLTKPGSLEDRAVAIKDIRANPGTPPGIRATPSGLAVVGVGLLDNLEANRVLLTYLSILFVAAFLTVRLRSLIRSLLSLVPVLIAVGVSSLVAFSLSLKLSPVTAVGGPLIVAACTEFTSLILLRFVEERGRGLGPQEAVDVAAARTGRAFIVSGLTAISGVAVIATSSLPLLRDFGIIVGLNIAVALASALVVLPPILAWADQRNWVSRHMIPDEMLNAWSDQRTPPPTGTRPPGEPAPVAGAD